MLFHYSYTHSDTHVLILPVCRSPVCSEIVGCRAGDHVRLAMRVKVFTYPEDVCAVWVMFAVKYRSIL